MADTFWHGAVGIGENSVLYNFKYATEADRTAALPSAFTATDIEKIAYVTASTKYYTLTSIDPTVVWSEIGGATTGLTFPAQIIHVSKNGKSPAEGGDRSTTAPYALPSQALASITTSDSDNRFEIKLTPSVFIEADTLQLKSYVALVCTAPYIGARIECSNTSKPIAKGRHYAEVLGILFGNASNAAGIVMEEPGILMLHNVAFDDCKYGIHCNHASAIVEIITVGLLTQAATIDIGLYCTAGQLKADRVVVMGLANIGVVCESDGSTAMAGASSLTTFSNLVGHVILAKNASTALLYSSKIAMANIGIEVQSGSSVECSGVSFSGIATWDLKMPETAAGETFHGYSTELVRSKISASDDAHIHAFGFDTGAQKYRCLAPMSVGRVGKGEPSFFGKGSSFQEGVKVLTYDGTSYADKDLNASISFAASTAGNMIYFGETNEHCVHGIEFLLETEVVLGAGSMVCEYYDGGTSSWLELQTMQTLRDYSTSQNGNPYTGTTGKNYANRFDFEVKSGVKESSLSATGCVSSSVNGINGKWIRCRITSDITTSMVIKDVFLQSSYTHIRENGTTVYAGEARGKEHQMLIFGDSAGTTSSIPVSISQNITYPFQENSFQANATDRTYTRWIIPEEFDTSGGIKFAIRWCSPESDTVDRSGIMHVYMAKSTEGHVNDGSAADEEIVLTATYSANDAQYKDYTIISGTRFDTHDLKPGDSVFFCLERLTSEAGDDLDDINLMNAWVEYYSWQRGSSYE